MPLLPAETTLFPECLFEDTPPPEWQDRSWWVLHTKPRQEKSLARHLQDRCIAHYLPLVSRRWRSRGRVLTSHNPLFTSYLFLLTTPEERISALASGRVVHSLKVADQERLWRDLRQIYRLIATGAPITPQDRLAPGTVVEIQSGALAGLTGKILRTASGRRFVVEVDFIQRGAAVELDDVSLNPLL